MAKQSDRIGTGKTERDTHYTDSKYQRQAETPEPACDKIHMHTPEQGCFGAPDESNLVPLKQEPDEPIIPPPGPCMPPYLLKRLTENLGPKREDYRRSQYSPLQAFIAESFNSSELLMHNRRFDVVDTPIYDTVTIGPGSTLDTLSSYLFTDVGYESGKTLAHTNLCQPQKLNAPECFSIFGFLFRYADGASLQDIYAVLQGFVFEYWMGHKVYHRSPVWMLCPQEGGNKRVPPLEVPIVIAWGMQFWANLNGTGYKLSADGTGITYQVCLRGLHARGVA